MKCSDDLLKIEWLDASVSHFVKVQADDAATSIITGRSNWGDYRVGIPNDPNVLLALAAALEARVYALYDAKSRDTPYNELRAEWTERFETLMSEFNAVTQHWLEARLTVLSMCGTHQLGVWVESMRGFFSEAHARNASDVVFRLKNLVNEISYYEKDI